MRGPIIGFTMTLAGLPAVPDSGWAYGEGVEGRPNHAERLVHVFTNQIRQEPHAWPDWDTSLATNLPRRPLLLDDDLVRAARFHADDMANNGCFQHDSCDGTPFAERIRRFFSGGAAGENIYAASGFGHPTFALTGWMTSEGHRTNILRESWTHLGPGFAENGPVYYVQNFGSSGIPPIPAIPGAAADAQAGNPTRLIANFFDPSGQPPRAMEAILDGVRIPLVHVAGPPGNETLAADVAAPGTCVPLTFEAIRSSGHTTVFPTTGALLVGPDCSASFGAVGGDGTIAADVGPKIDDEGAPGGCRSVAQGSISLCWLCAIAVSVLRITRRRRTA